LINEGRGFGCAPLRDSHNEIPQEEGMEEDEIERGLREARKAAQARMDRGHMKGGEARAVALVLTKIDEAQMWLNRASLEHHS
jgi:hypothetical protein